MLLAEYRGVRKLGDLDRLTKRQVFAWVQAHFHLTGDWSSRYPRGLPDAPGETWQNLDAAFRVVFHGLPGGSSLARLLSVVGCVAVRSSPFDVSMLLRSFALWSSWTRHATAELALPATAWMNRREEHRKEGA